MSDVTGFRGGVRTGIGLSVGGVPARGNGQISLSAHGPIQGVSRWSVLPLDPTCGRFPEGLACPQPSEAKLLFHVSGLLDFAAPIEMDGAATATVSHQGQAESVVEIPVAIPPLETGRHCILLALLEDEQTVVEGQFPDHGNVALFVIDNGQTEPNHCTAPGAWPPESWLVRAGGPMGRCGPPTLSGRRASAQAGELSVAISLCGPATVAVLARDGELLGADAPYPPFLVEAATEQTVGLVAPLPNLPTGWWRAISVALDPGGPNLALYSRPVWIGMP